jgi:hypothetical protein
MSTKTCQAEMATISYETVDGATSGTISVPTGSPSSPEGALKTHLQSTFGWRPYDIVLEMYEPDKYVILFDTASMRFIRAECSVAAATTEADKYTVQKELCAYIKRDNIRELDLNEIYSHYNIITICTNAFVGCTSLTTITIPYSVTSIGWCAFRGCTSLTTIAIPDSVTSIRWSAFHNCTSLTTIAIPDSVTAIGAYAFTGCTSLTTVAIPDSVTTIGYHAFAGCCSLVGHGKCWK